MGALVLLAALMLGFGGTPRAQAQSFTATGSMTANRSYHTATLLNNGTVLVTGGFSQSSAEIYNPTTRTFSATTGNMSVSRFYHTATLLNDGTVLIAGGSQGNESVATAEIYNPSTRTFSVTAGAMSVARSRHTATLLNNGTVLIAGGTINPYNTESGFLATAEIYNPSTRTFTALSGTGTMGVARSNPQAVRLNDGTVLVVGGRGTTGYLSSAEIYNPATQSFSFTTGNMVDKRFGCTLTLLGDGTALITGGNGDNTVKCELYNPSTKTFAATGSMAVSRINHAASLLNDGTVLVTGNSTVAEIYNPTTGTFSTLSNGTLALRSNHRSTLLNDGSVLLTGGSSGTAVAETYDPGPRIISFSPTGGVVGDRVTITGVGFTNVVGVTFNGVSAPYTVDYPMQITATVPSGATTGPIRVLRSAGTLVSSTNFVVYGPTVVTTTSDTENASDGVISLREAITYANNNPGADTITFAIPGTGVQTIQLNSSLPFLGGTNGAGTVIDGYSQSGASANTLSTGTNAVIKIEIRGQGTGNFPNLYIVAANCTVKGLSFINSYASIILYNGATGNKVTGNFIGVRADGTTASGHTLGLVVDGASTANNTIGGTSASERNLISGNTGGPGLYIINGATGTKVLGNAIGLAADGVTSLANGDGIFVSAQNTTIGGIAVGEGNFISGNTREGVIIAGGTGNSVRGNSIYSNGTTTSHLGIDLGNAGVTANDDGDPDTGANNLQNFPVLSSVSSSGGNTVITGTLNSTPNTTFALDFYSSPRADTSGYGEGKTYLGSTSVTTDGTGNVSFSATLSGGTSAAGIPTSATATDPTGNTSEFSQTLASDPSGAASFVVTTTSDVVAVDGVISLREAINNAKANPGPDTITFAIPGAGVQILSFTEPLPIITGANAAGTVIDGFSQTGASANTLSYGTDAVVKIELKGPGSNSYFGFRIEVPDCAIKGLSITNYSSGVYLAGATGAKITGNFLGVRSDGITSSANQYGVYVSNASGNTIGGATPAERNLISGNTSAGVFFASGSANNKALGNVIGTTANGRSAVSNDTGVLVSAADNVIGGAATGEGNLISGNTRYGVSLNGASKVLGNIIGKSGTGVTAFGNDVGVYNNAVGGIVGGVATGEGNLITGNTHDGVTIAGGTGNSVRGNSIYSNGTTTTDLNIDIVGTDGVDVNDAQDADSGPNGIQNFPVLSSVVSRGNSTIVSGVLSSTPSSPFTLDFYSNTGPLTTSIGGGKTYLGSTSVTTDGTGSVSFTATLQGVNVAPTEFVSATANAGDGSTSEFSEMVPNVVRSIQISEFRLSGPNGASDEYVELANQSGAAVSLSGFTLSLGTPGATAVTVDLYTRTIPAFGHLLITGSGYSLSGTYPSTYPVGSTAPSGYAKGDITYGGDAPLNSTITLSKGGDVVDQVGDLSGTVGLVSNSQYAFVRRQDGAAIVDTDDDTNDFNLVSTSSTKGSPTDSGVSTLVAGARLGTPGPQNSASPGGRPSLTLVPLDPATNQGIVPDGRYASRGSNLDPFGRLTLRRTITNYSNQTIKQIRFVLVRTTAGTGVSSGSGQASGVADLRAITSVGVSANGSKVVQAIQIEAPTTPTTPSNQLSSSDTGNGGGLNASWNVGTLPAGGLAPGASMNVEFVFGIVKEGNYNVSIVIQTAS